MSKIIQIVSFTKLIIEMIMMVVIVVVIVVMMMRWQCRNFENLEVSEGAS